MAERYLIVDHKLPEGVPMPESWKRRQERDEKLTAEKTAALVAKAEEAEKAKAAMIERNIAYEAEYKAAERDLVEKRREAKATGQFYKEADPKVMVIIRLKGINKLAPKPRKILQLLRLRQLHNGVFLKINKATMNMLKCVTPFVTFGYPSLSTIRKMIYKRGYAKVGKIGASQRIRIQSNDIISETLGKFGIHGVEDLVHEIHTCGPHFKEANNFLWPFKFASPRKGFAAKRHGFTEPRKGDWGNRENMINTLIERMN